MNDPALFGFFPDIQPGRYGGVEQSGRLAWDALNDLRGERAQLFMYAPNSGRVQEAPGTIVARTKGEAIRRALNLRVKPRVILVWHLAMLKLVPLLRAPHACVVVFLHGIEAWRAQDLLTRQLLGRVHLFLTNSEFTRARFLEYAPGAGGVPYRITPPGVDEPLREHASPTDPPALLLLGRLARGEDYKGHRELIAAWAQVRARVPGARLWIAGEGDLRPALEELAR
jgi:glycosyltransferase involved in cell wall biosynthesis